MAKEFGKLTINPNNTAQIEALKKIADPTFGINGGRILKTGNDLSIFQGDIEKLKESNLSKMYNEEQIQALFDVMDADGSGQLDADEISSLASMGKDVYDCIPDDQISIDETDMSALYKMACSYVDEVLQDDTTTTSTTTTTKPSTTTTTTTTTTTKPSVSKGSTAVSSQTTVSQNSATLSDNEAASKAAELRSAMDGLGTDEAKVAEILEGSGYSSADIVKIMNSFQEQYGESLISDIQGDFSGSEETMHRQMLYSAASEQALLKTGWKSTDDIPADIVKKANELYEGVAGNNKFWDHCGAMEKFDKYSDAEKAQILLASELLHPGELTINRITEGNTYGLGGTEDKYVRNIMDALLNVANGKVKI